MRQFALGRPAGSAFIAMMSGRVSATHVPLRNRDTRQCSAATDTCLRSTGSGLGAVGAAASGLGSGLSLIQFATTHLS
jgi:hypothetical protein